MSTSESDSSVFAEEDEEGKLYQWIFEMSIRDDNREETEKTQIAPSSEHTPEHLEINAERRTHATGNIEALDMGELQNIQGNQEQNLKVKSSREKPWRESGANISDYFNYGFDEESWMAYCEKQAEIHAVSKTLQAKFLAQKRHTGHREEESSCASSPSGRPSIVASRDPHAATAEIRGQPRSRNRDYTLNNTQVDTEMSHKEDSITAYHLPPPSNISYPLAYVSPPSSIFLSRPSPPSPPAIFDRHSNDFDGPLTLYAHSSGKITPRAGVTDTVKAWEYYTRHLMCDRHRDRSREHGRDKGSKRGRDREKDGRSSSCNSAKEQKKHRNTSERRHICHSSQRVSGERRQRDKSEDWQKTSQSSSSGGRSRSRRDDGEDRESRHTHKKARRSRKGKESNISADQERKLKSA